MTCFLHTVVATHQGPWKWDLRVSDASACAGCMPGPQTRALTQLGPMAWPSPAQLPPIGSMQQLAHPPYGSHSSCLLVGPPYSGQRGSLHGSNGNLMPLLTPLKPQLASPSAWLPPQARHIGPWQFQSALTWEKAFNPCLPPPVTQRLASSLFSSAYNTSRIQHNICHSLTTTKTHTLPFCFKQVTPLESRMRVVVCFR